MSTSNLSKDISRVVRGLLAERKVTVQEFAHSIGRPNSTVARWINQGGASDTDGLEAIADGLGMDVLELIRLAIERRGDDPGGLGAAIDKVRPPKRPHVRRSQRQTGS